MEKKTNKQIVLEFYKRVVRDRNSGLIDFYISDRYIQHSPSLKPGKPGLHEAIEFLKTLPQSADTKSPIFQALEDDNHVMVHLQFEFLGVKRKVIDIFRLEEGMIVEHWDAVQEHTDVAPSQIQQKETDMDLAGVELTSENKQIVHRFLQSTERSGFVSDDYREHCSEIIETAGRIDRYLDRSIRSVTTIHRVLGEGDLVVAQSEGSKGSRPFVFYDVFKVKARKIAEHWGVEQEIPDVMPHDHGMI